MSLSQIDFHDTGSNPRVPSMTDHFGFTMAALNEKGSVFANPCKGEKDMSTLMYRPFSSWAGNSEVRLLHIFYMEENLHRRKYVMEPSSFNFIWL